MVDCLERVNEPPKVAQIFAQPCKLKRSSLRGIFFNKVGKMRRWMRQTGKNTWEKVWKLDSEDWVTIGLVVFVIGFIGLQVALHG